MTTQYLLSCSFGWLVVRRGKFKYHYFAFGTDTNRRSPGADTTRSIYLHVYKILESISKTFIYKIRQIAEWPLLCVVCMTRYLQSNACCFGNLQVFRFVP